MAIRKIKRILKVGTGLRAVDCEFGLVNRAAKKIRRIREPRAAILGSYVTLSMAGLTRLGNKLAAIYSMYEISERRANALLK